VGRLADIYRAAAAESGPLGVDEAAVESRLVELCARGRAAHPSFGVADADFVTHLARCGAPVLDVLSALHAEDLYLACACLSGNAAALVALQAESRRVLARYLKKIHGGAAIFEEVEQQLWNAVLVGAGEGPKLAGYAGRGPLGSWIGVSAQRIALMMLRHERVEVRARKEAAAQQRVVTDDPEMAAVKDRYRDEFQAALEAALGGLDDRDMTLYRMHFVDGIGTAEIGVVYSVSAMTVRRWLAAARGRIVEGAKRHLRAHLHVSSGEFDSIVGLLMSQVDLNLSQILNKQK
jgi:RNA polymerase sigma-70 factor (ECF subfamily)